MMSQNAFLLFTMFLAGSLPVLAQENSSSLSMDAAPAKEEKPFHLTMNLTASSNMYKQGSPDREASTELTLNPSMNLTEETSLGFKGTVTHEETGARNTLLSNTTIRLTTKGPQVGVLESGFSFSGILPTDEVEFKKSRLQGALGVGTSLKGQWKNLQASYGLSLNRNFHEFTVNAEGSPNVQHSLTQVFAVEAELNSKWSLSTSATYKIGRTYRDFERQTYGYDASINYNLSESLQASVGWSNEGKALKADGTSTNIQLYNENTSAVMAGITFVN